MRVLHINCNYIYSSLHQNMISGLEKQNVSNHVIVPVYSRNIKTADSYGVQIIRCFNKWDRIWFGFKQRKIFKAVKQVTHGMQFDCIHAYTLFSDGNCAMKLSKEYGIPYVVAVRNTDVNTFFKYMPHLRGIGITVLENASRVFFLSETYKQQVISRYVPKHLQKYILEKSMIIPNGIDDYWLINKYKERNMDKIVDRLVKHKLRLIYAGNIDRNKNIRTTIRAMRSLENDGWTVDFEVIGDVVEENEYSKIKNEHNVKYIEKLPKEQLIERYRNADIFVMPSHTETFGLVYAEAMSQGLPVLYTEGQGFDGQFSEGIVGYHVDSDDYKDVAEKIKKIVKNYTKISKKCIELVDAFDWANITKVYCTVYEQITNMR